MERIRLLSEEQLQDSGTNNIPLSSRFLGLSKHPCLPVGSHLAQEPQIKGDYSYLTLRVDVPGAFRNAVELLGRLGAILEERHCSSSRTRPVDLSLSSAETLDS